MGKAIHEAFERQTVSVDLDDLLPLRQVPPEVLKSREFYQILSSVREVGIIEPPSVIAQEGGTGKCYLAHGYLRVEALRILEIPTVVCLIATDDEAYTYNKRVTRLAPIQEHRMILKAIERGVSEARIARALNVNIESIRKKRDLLRGICPEAVTLLRDRQSPYETFRCLRSMRPLRQIEAVQLMIDIKNFSVSYARSLLLATPRDQLVAPSTPRRGSTQASKHMARLEREMGNLRGQPGVQRRYAVRRDVARPPGTVGTLQARGRALRSKKKLTYHHMHNRHPEHNALHTQLATRAVGVEFTD